MRVSEYTEEASERQSLGLCCYKRSGVFCDKPVTAGKRKCAEHLAADSAKTADRRKKKKPNECRVTGCNKDKVPGKSSCQEHLESSRKDTQKTRDTNRAAGLCLFSTKANPHPPMEGHTVCAAHSASMTVTRMADYNAAKAVGKCPCGKTPEHDPEPGYTTCKDARARDKASRDTCKRAALEHYSHVKSGESPFCCMCGNDDYDTLQLDHIGGGGNAHRKEIGKAIYQWAKNNNYPPRLRVVCANCHVKLHKEDQE
jgi:hypothetical protein